MTSTLKRQSKAVVLSKSQQDELLNFWQSNPHPCYLVQDSDGNVLRNYGSLVRAENWTKGTDRIICFNPAAITKRGLEHVELSRQNGGAGVWLLAFVWVFVVPAWLLLKLAGYL